MNIVREYLQKSDPELYRAYIDSWEIVNRDLFPMMATEKNSLNSYPHSINLENYLVHLITETPHLLEENHPDKLKPVEIYILLCAILFHDIGRIWEIEGIKNHGTLTKNKIDVHYSIWRFYSEELALLVGKICEYHEPEPQKKVELKDEIIDRFGLIRMRELGALLVMIDNMDTTYRRLAPLYLFKETEQSDPISKFRGRIKGVFYDKKAQAIILSTSYNVSEKNYKFSIKKFKHTIIKKEIPEEIEERNKFFQMYNINISKDRMLKKVIKFLIPHNVTLKTKLTEDKMILSNSEIHTNEIFTNLILYGYTYVSLVSNNKDWPDDVIIPMIFSSMRKGHFDSTKRCLELKRLGINVRCWLLQFNNKLYNIKWEESYEPIFNEKFLENILRSMWQLDSGILYKNSFSYNELCSASKEPEYEKVRMAVKRISEIVKNESNLKIWYDNISWRLIFENKNTESEKLDLLNDLNYKIKNELKSPIVTKLQKF